MIPVVGKKNLDSQAISGWLQNIFNSIAEAAIRGSTISIVLLAMMTSYCSGQEQVVSFPGITVKLGMPREVVLELLNDDTFVSYRVDAERISILEKDAPHYAIGSLSFDNNDKLAYASREWIVQEDPQAIAFATSLASLVKNVNEAGNIRASIDVDENRDPRSSSTTIRIDFGEKRIKIQILSTPKEGSYLVRIDELLSKLSMW